MRQADVAAVCVKYYSQIMESESALYSGQHAKNGFALTLGLKMNPLQHVRSSTSVAVKFSLPCAVSTYISETYVGSSYAASPLRT